MFIYYLLYLNASLWLISHSELVIFQLFVVIFVYLSLSCVSFFVFLSLSSELMLTWLAPGPVPGRPIR